MKSKSYEASHYEILPQHLIISSLFDPNILLNTMFSNTFSVCSSLNTRGQVSHPYNFFEVQNFLILVMTLWNRLYFSSCGMLRTWCMVYTQQIGAIISKMLQKPGAKAREKPGL
jgi:hypothetical protein